MDSKQIISSYPLYCDNCWTTKTMKIRLNLKLLQTVSYDAKFERADADIIDDLTQKSIPTFKVDQGMGEEMWEAKFECPFCKQTPWLLNKNAVYDEDEDELYIPCLDADSILGWNKPRLPDEQDLPKIVHLRDLVEA